MKILVVAAHPDDEILGCGGTLLRHRDRLDEIVIVIAAAGGTDRSNDQKGADHYKDQLELKGREIATKLKAKTIHFFGLIDNRLDGIERLEITKRIEKINSQVKPDIVYTHHGSDLNVDHRRVFECVLTACRPLPGRKTPDIYCFETVSSTEWQDRNSARVFSPTYYVDIETKIDEKLEILKVYDCEMKEWPHPRSYEGVLVKSKLRGCEIGVNNAEAFEVIRQVWN